ncbi:spermatogenesis-associated protein 31E1-like [Ochotona princeps]|uniref:spermatogenesis-associated protein 31E1-like n=1 Tax=Ochotona princeps TaxID=9978 RepID=UPI002714BE36|nr:spermatogenesis-associated protein 31E1-like [Ochotona princeps]
MEGHLPLRCVRATCPGPSFTFWVVDIILPILCGVGIFLLILPCLKSDPSSPPARNKNIRKSPAQRRRESGSRKKSVALKACREFLKEVEEASGLIAPLQSPQGRTPDKNRALHLLYQDSLGEEYQPPLTVASPTTLTPLTSSAPLVQAPLHLSSCLSQISHEIQSDLQRIPVGPIPENSPSGNSYLTSHIMAISGLSWLSGLFSLFWWWAAAKTLLLCASLPGRAQQKNLCHHSPDASGWGDPTRRQIEAGASSFISSDVQKLLEKLISKRVEQRWEGKYTEESFLKETCPDCHLTSLRTLLQSLSDKQGTTMLQPSCRIKKKPVQLPGAQQISYPKVFRDHLESEYSQLFWGLPSLHSESLVANVHVSTKSLKLRNPSIKFNVGSSPSPGHSHAKDTMLGQSLPKGLSYPGQRQIPDHVPCFPPTKTMLSPSDGRTCKTSCPTSQQRARSIIPVYNEQMEWPFQKPDKLRRALISHCQKSQEVTGQSTPRLPHGNQDYTASYWTSQEKPPSVISTKARKMEQPLQKQQKQRKALASHLPNSQETTGQPTARFLQDSQASYTFKTSSALPGYSISTKLRDPQKQQSQMRVFKDEHQDGALYRAGASLEVVQPKGKTLPVSKCQTKDFHHSCQSNPFTGIRSNEEQLMGSMRSRRIFGKGSVRFKLDKPIRNLGQETNYPEDLVWGPGSTSTRFLESRKSERCLARPGKGFYETFIAGGLNKKYIEKTLKAHLGRKLGQIHEGKIPVKVRRSWFAVNCASPKIYIHPKSRNLASPKGQKCCINTSRELSFLDPLTQQMLETHIIRFRVRQKWGLHLQALEPKNLSLGVVQTLPLPQSTLRQSGAKLKAKATGSLREPTWKDPGKKMMTKKSVPMLKNSPFPPSPAPKEVKRTLRMTSFGSNLRPPMTPQTGQQGRLPAQPLTYKLPGRSSESHAAQGTGRDGLEVSSRQVMAKYGAHKQTRDVALSDPCCSTSILVTKAGSPPPRAEETKGLAKEKVSSWEVSVETSTAAHSHVNVSLKGVESLGMKKTPYENSNGQYAGQPCMKRLITKELELQVDVESENQPQDMTTSTVQQDQLPLLLSSTAISASQGPLGISKSVSTDDMLALQGLGEPLSRERSSQGQEPQISKLKVPQKSVSKTFGPPDKREICRRPKPAEKEERATRQKILSAHGRSLPAQGRDTGHTLGSKSSPLLPGSQAKNTVCISPTTKGKEKTDFLQNVKPASTIARSKGTVISRYFVEKKEQEARAIMTFVAKILADKLRLHYGHGSLELSWAREDAETVVGRHSCNRGGPLYLEHRKAVTEMDFGHKVTPKDQRYAIKNKYTKDRESNRGASPRKPVSQASPCQFRSTASAPGHLHHYSSERGVERCVLSHQPGHVSHPFPGAKASLLERCQFVRRKIV